MTNERKAGLAGVLASPWFFLGAMAAALIIRVAWAIAAGDAQRFHDSDSYIKIADNLLAGNGFLWGDQRVGRPPLYPLLVAATRFDIFGRHFLALYLVQAVLSAATIALLAASAKRLLGGVAAGVTALVLALDPFLVFHVGTVLSETLFTFFFAAVFFGVMIALGRGGVDGGRGGQRSARPVTGALIAGMAAGASFLTRPSLLWLVIAFAAIVALWARPRARALFAAAAMLATAFAVTLPWGVRNHAVTGHWIFTTLGVGASLYDGVGPQADGSSNMDFLLGAPEVSKMSEYDRDRYWHDKAVDAAAADPLRIARLALVKVARFWSPVPNSDRFSGARYVAASLAAVLPVYLFAIAALALGAVPRRGLFIIMAAPVYFTMIHSIFVASARYRTPVMPFVVMLAAAGAAWLLSPGERRGKPS